MQLDDQTKAAIVSHAIGAYPAEACGLLGAEAEAVTSLYACANIAEDPSACYIVSPADQREAEAEMRERAETLVGIYHSHVRGPAEPSEPDRQIAQLRPGVVQVIVSLVTDELRAWVLDERHESFLEVTV